jgi:hypothetical protein
MSEWPVHHSVCCFQCEEQLDIRDMQRTESARGDGAFSQYCKRCGMYTFYDIERDPDEARDDKLDREADAEWRWAKDWD